MTQGEEIEKSQVVKGYEYDRGQFVTVSAAELKALDVESSNVIDLERFVPRGDIDPVYFDTPYYLYPDGPIAVEGLRVIGAAMAEAGVAGIGRLTLSRRERMVMVEPRGIGMALFTLRAADEVRPAQFGSAEGDFDAELTLRRRVSAVRAIRLKSAGRSFTRTALLNHPLASSDHRQNGRCTEMRGAPRVRLSPASRERCSTETVCRRARLCDGFSTPSATEICSATTRFRCTLARDARGGRWHIHWGP
jgi:Ku70/Ku80 beta-barrel domain